MSIGSEQKVMEKVETSKTCDVLRKILWRGISTPLVDAARSLLGPSGCKKVSDIETLIFVVGGRLLLARYQKRMSAGLVTLISWLRRLML